MDLIFYIFVLLFSVVIHEVSHGYAAKAQGDDTAEVMGRLTLNPFVHLDIFGSVILPLVLVVISKLTGSSVFLFGWAKPVPYNPLKLKNYRWGSFLVAVAGPLSNIILAVIFGLLIRFGVAGINSNLGFLFSVIVLINLMLAIFNLIPIPPLDGSKVFAGFFGERWTEVDRFLIENSLVLLALFLFFGSGIIFPIVLLLFRLITGMSL